MEELTGVLIEYIRQHKEWAVLVIFVLAFGESIAFVSLVLPFWAMLIAIGTLVDSSGLNLPALWVSAACGAALGDWFSYWLGRHFHLQIGAMWPLSRYPDLLPRGHTFMQKYGVFAIVIGRFFGPLRASVPLAAGAVEMDRMSFQLANWSSAFLWAGVLLFFGNGLGRVLEWMWDKPELGAVLVGIVAVCAAVFYYYFKSEK